MPTTATQDAARTSRNTAIAALTSERTWLKNELSVLLRTTAGLEEQLARVEGALAALSGQAPPARPSAIGASFRERKTKKRRSKPTAPGRKYVALVRELLAGRGKIAREELFKLVGERVAQQGHSRVGIRVRVPAALRELGYADRDGSCWEISNGTKK